MTVESFPEQFERGAAALLCEDLAGVDDDDDVRTGLLLDSLIEAMLQRPDFTPPVPFVSRDEALAHLERLRDRRITAGELRAGIRLALAELSG